MDITKNSDLLFIYDAKMTNPNGDMDNENKPRMDYDTDTNLVSDVRLKRYLRDYFETDLGLPIFITDKAADAKDRNAQLKKEKKEHKDLIDIRLFGAVLAEKEANTHITGPVQFNWGYSLNPVELNESVTITSSFSSGQGVGKDYRVKYSMIAFSGGINAKVAKNSGLTEEDVTLLDKALILAIPANRTRSKIGQTPRFYLRVQMNNNQLVLKDLREYVSLAYETDNPFMVRDVLQVTLDITGLLTYLKGYQDKIETVFLWQDESLKVKGLEELKTSFANQITLLNPMA